METSIPWNCDDGLGYVQGTVVIISVSAEGYRAPSEYDIEREQKAIQHLQDRGSKLGSLGRWLNGAPRMEIMVEFLDEAGRKRLKAFSVRRGDDDYSSTVVGYKLGVP